MREIETDYLVIGAGATGMAFVDALLAGSDASVVMVDRRHRAGGHWLDAYPFVRLHQPSANYGVTSRPLGHDRIDDAGPNAGFYERATAAEICDYWSRVMDEDFLRSGRVQFLSMSDYRGADADGHHVVSVLTGAETLIRAKKFVDATYVESEIPFRHRPSFAFDPDVRLVPPNDLVDLAEPAAGFTVVGAGKTAMDTCVWLLEAGVDPDRIRWIRSRDPWLFDRAGMQPLELVGAYMQMQGHWVQAAAEAESGPDFAHRMEASGALVRIDPDVEPAAFRGAIISIRELEALRSIERIVRRRVVAITRDRVAFADGELESGAGEVYVDCTAAGVRPTVGRPIFEGDRITLQYVTIGIPPLSAATIGRVETARADDADKNRLCPTLTFTGDAADMLELSYAGMLGLMARAAEPDLAEWNEACRLNPAAGAMSRFEDPQVAAGFTAMATHIGPAMQNLDARIAARRSAVPAARADEPDPTALVEVAHRHGGTVGVLHPVVEAEVVSRLGDAGV